MAEKRTGDHLTLGHITTAPVAHHTAATDSTGAQCEDLEKDAKEPQDISCIGDAKEDGYVIIKNAIRKDIITTTEVDKSDPKVAKDGRRRCFQNSAPDEKIREYFCTHVPKTFLIDLGLSKDNAEMIPEIEFWEYMPDSRDSQRGRLAGDGNFVYVIIAMSEPLSTNEGLPEFVRGSHRLQVRSVSEIFRMPTTQITLHMGWALAWTSELSYKLPQGGGGSSS
ncbi:hypothetical protein K469DRAFT_683305 [Zopfia rhizophila CBS 207.26]|uniref:Uncharacterized protein n=1 Tax=Zopfia rhizophila CBS 207.26 TaxID=1314779 RepID=A0A6A6EGJ8_9PEZI|nr:hypothetical protein K469DRAFT_683305 [Zopfia rhizophila CBS 207.26]